MKKLYKFTSIILVSIILVNALLSNIVLADPIMDHASIDHSQIQTPEDVDKYGESGKAEGSSDAVRPVERPDGKKETVDISQAHDRDTNLQSEQGSFIASVIASIIKMIPRVLQILMSQVVGADADSENLFTIQNLLTGKYELFDINIFNKNVSSDSSSDISKLLKENVASWYGTIKTIAIMASLVVLLYVAVRMAMSTTLDESVKYKKMLLSWGVGFVLIFVLHYIALFLITLSDQLVRMLASLAPSNQTPFEYSVMYRIFYADAQGWDTVLQAILYAMLVWYQAKFFYMYLKRVISNAFLILISPLVTVTYAIDKASDLKAQAFNSWLEELITNIFIQPMHLLMFLVLLYSAGAIAELYPIIAILFLLGLGKTEGIIRGLFKLKGSSISGIEEGTGFTSLLRVL